jgi:SAM-dependent methyltransferase
MQKEGTLPASRIDEKNIAFWDELCGTSQARQLGVTDSSPGSLEKFDAWYFELYPYLFDHVRLQELVGRDVLEIGLGYGSLSQKIAESGARYVGLDIAAGPVEMVRHRMQQAGLSGQAEQGSIVGAPFPDESFDCVITIGCLHHTGDMGRAIAECRRMLRPGGSLVAMVYYAYSYRRWVQARRQTLNYLWSEMSAYRGVATPKSERERWIYDHNSEGLAAPHTDFVSVKSLRYLCRDFSKFQWKLRNIDQEPPFRARSRDSLLKTVWPSLCGLEIYATVIK